MNDDKFSNELNFDDEVTDDYWNTSDDGEFVDNSVDTVDNFDNGGDIPPDKPKKKIPIWLMVVGGIIILLVIFIMVKLGQAKKHQEENTEVVETATDAISYNYEGYKYLLASGTSSEYGFDYATKQYNVQSGTKAYTNIVNSSDIISQNAWVDLTTESKKQILTDILAISDKICSNANFDSEYDTQMIQELNSKDYIDKSLLSIVLSENGRNLLNDELSLNNEYEVKFFTDESVEKIYDVNGSKVVFIDIRATVNNDESVNLIIITEEAGNVERIPIEVSGKSYEVERDNAYDEIVNGYITGYGYSVKLQGIGVGAEYELCAKKFSNSEELEKISVFAMIPTGSSYTFKETFKKEEKTTPTDASSTDAKETVDEGSEEVTTEMSTEGMVVPKSQKNPDGEDIDTGNTTETEKDTTTKEE